MRGWTKNTQRESECTKQLNKLKEENRSLISQLSNVNQKILYLNDQIQKLEIRIKSDSSFKEKEYFDILEYVEEKHKFFLIILLKFMKKEQERIFMKYVIP